MVTSALILDCDGVLADTELHGHLVAFNQTFEEFGLPVRWSVEEYKQKVLIGGGKERLASLLTPEFVAAAGLPADPGGQRAAVAAWHRRKTEIYLDLVARGAVPPRPGVARLVGEALAAGWLVAVASTWSRPRSPPRTSTCLPPAPWGCPPTAPSSSRTRATGCWRRSGPGSPAWSPSTRSPPARTSARRRWWSRRWEIPATAGSRRC